MVDRRRIRGTPPVPRGVQVTHRPLHIDGVVHVSARDVDAGGHLHVHADNHDGHGHELRFSAHDAAVLAFIASGGGHVRVDDRAEFVAGTDDVVVFPAGVPHRVRWSARSHLICVAVCATCAGVDGDACWARVRAGGAPVVHLADDRRGFVDALLTALQDEQARPAPSSQALLSLLTLLLVEVGRAGDAPLQQRRNDDDDLVAAALRYVEQHCLTALKPKDVARALHKSSTHLTTLVRKKTGQPLQAWITAGRIAEARRRLQTSDERIDVIAERVGYGDVRSFVRAFRAATGQTPAAHRRAPRA